MQYIHQSFFCICLKSKLGLYLKLCKNYCKTNNLRFYLHDDLFLPTLKEQLEIFNKAKIIMGPHGGGGVNLIAAKEKTYFIEFLNEQDINICYTQLAHHLNINYLR